MSHPPTSPISTKPPLREEEREILPDAMFRQSLSPEAEFVLLGARTQLAGARRARFDELLDCGGASPEEESGLNWRLVLDLSRKHRVTGLLGRHLSARSWRGVPRPLALSWGRYFGAMTLHGASLAGELARVTHVLESAGVPVVSFKGPTLAHQAYGNSAVRPSADLDVLVSRSQVQRAHKILCEMGYAHEALLSPAQERAHLRLDSVFNLLRPAPEALQNFFPEGFALELHWAITSPCLPFDLTFEDLAPRLGWMQLPGTSSVGSSAGASGSNGSAASSVGSFSNGPATSSTGSTADALGRVRTLALPDLLLILCVHGAKHLWERLLWLCDVAQLLDHAPDLDWDAVLRGAKARGIERMTALGLSLTRDVMGVVLPREVEEWLSTQPQALRLASRLRASLLWHRDLPAEDYAVEQEESWETSDEELPALESNRLLAQAIDNPWKRAGFFWHLATTPTAIERAQVPLPSGFESLWWVLGPLHALQSRWRRFERDR